MCDEQTEKDIENLQRRLGKLNRRDFGKLSAVAGLTTLLPKIANALEVTAANVEVVTPDGVADCYFAHPSSGRHPAVLIWPDIMGRRPAFEAMGKRLAESGYCVLVVNPFYRSAKAPVLEAGANFGDPATRAIVMPMRELLTAEANHTDAKAFIAYLDQQPQVDTSRKIGSSGYCMGGPIVMRTAAAMPGRVAAGATFHGGGLATDKPDSPHLLIPTTKAQVLHAVAENDDEKNPEVKHTLRAAYQAAGLAAEIEVYKGTLHGWCPIDSRVYNQEQAERAWSRMLALFKKTLV